MTPPEHNGMSGSADLGAPRDLAHSRTIEIRRSEGQFFGSMQTDCRRRGTLGGNLVGRRHKSRNS